MQLSLPTFLLATLAITAVPVFGDIFPVPNFSFEDSPPGYGNPPGWTLFTSSTSPTFGSNTMVIANNGSISGVTGSQYVGVHVDHNDLNVTNPAPVVPVNGSLAGLVSGDLGTFAPGTTYALTASIGLPNAFGLLNVGLALGSGAPTLADVFPGPNSSFASVLINGDNLSDRVLQDETITLDTKAFPGLVGTPINASLIFQSEFMYGRDAFFDDVTLTSTTDTATTPEPSLFGVMGVLGGLGLLVLRFQRTRAAAVC